MNTPLEPRAVAIADIPHWLRESWGLLRRRWWVFVGLSAAYHYLAHATASLSAAALIVSLLLSQIAVCVGVVAARCADHSEPLGAGALYTMARNVMGGLLLLTVLYTAIYLAGAAVVMALGLDLPEAGGAALPPPPALMTLTLGFTAFLIHFMGLTISTLWFITPLIALHELRLLEAALLARRAEGKNRWVVFLVSYVPCIGLAVAALVSTWTLALSVVVLPLFGTLQYIAYRHVFLGQAASRPARAARTQMHPATARS